MRALGFVVMTLMLWLAGASAAVAQAPDPYSAGPHLATKLIAESTTPAAGTKVTLAYDVTPQPAGTAIGKIPAMPASRRNSPGRCRQA